MKIDKNTSVGVAGMGFVGGAIFRGFNLYTQVMGYDVDPKKSTHQLKEVANCDFVFVAVPTPMENVEGGKADLSIVEKALLELKNANTNPNTVFIIKSTVAIGSTRKFSEDLGIKRLIHSPEFLTERTADIDFITPARQIVGGLDEDANRALEELYLYRFPSTKCHVMGPEEAELVKYMANCFFATKVMYFNEMKLISDELGLDWQKIMDGTIADGRIGKSHHDVPGHDGDRGVGGKCVLPNAKVKLKNYMFSWDPASSDYPSIKDLYEINKKLNWTFEIASCDSECNKTEWKKVNDITKREIDEEIYVFETDEGNFECTGDHLMPVLRDGEKILIPAKEIKETDELFCNK